MACRGERYGMGRKIIVKKANSKTKVLNSSFFQVRSARRLNVKKLA
jgi:hypothetical protein